MKHSGSMSTLQQAGKGFTLVELLVSMTVLTLLIVAIGQLFSAATIVATQGTKRLDADAQARALFDRMSIDFAQMVKRSDVDYFLKDEDNLQPGNDQIAFYSGASGYYPAGTPRAPKSHIALMGYRVNSGSNEVERLGKGLMWNGVGTEEEETPVVFLPLTIEDTWPTATNMGDDPDYDTVGPQAFRFEYYYILKGQTLDENHEAKVSGVPWNADIDGHDSVSGMRDVAAIEVVIAVIDPKSQVLVPDATLATLAGNMGDFEDSMGPGDLEKAWQTAIQNAIETDIPKAAGDGLRVYRRSFPVSSN